MVNAMRDANRQLDPSTLQSNSCIMGHVARAVPSQWAGSAIGTHLNGADTGAASDGVLAHQHIRHCTLHSASGCLHAHRPVTQLQVMGSKAMVASRMGLEPRDATGSLHAGCTLHANMRLRSSGFGSHQPLQLQNYSPHVPCICSSDAAVWLSTRAIQHAQYRASPV